MQTQAVQSVLVAGNYTMKAVQSVLVAGNYTMKAVQTQVMLQGPAGREIWLGVHLRRGGVKITGWMQSGKLQRRVAGDGDWLARLRPEGKEQGRVKCRGALLGG